MHTSLFCYSDVFTCFNQVFYILKYLVLCCSDEWDDNVSRISVRDWSLVEYQGNMYPGEVQKIVCGEYQVSVTADKLAKRLKPPFFVNNRGHFGFLDL